MLKKLLGLFSKKTPEYNISVEVVKQESSEIDLVISKLKKQATRYKKEKKYEEACDSLQ